MIQKGCPRRPDLCKKPERKGHLKRINWIGERAGMRFLKAREGFYRELFRLVLPIVIQNLISSAVTMADVVMLGRVDQTVLSASSLAGQVQFLLNVVYFGLASAITILASQYWGKGDRKTISRIFGMGLLISLFFGVPAFVLAVFRPTFLMTIWTNVPELIDTGVKYLRVVAVSYLFGAVSQPYLAIMKSCERVKLSTAVSAITLGLNVLLNAVLIFGLLGFPAMGIIGAAAATAISRGVELLICAADFLHQRMIPRNPVTIFTIPRALVTDFARYSLPAFINDAMWGLAFNMNSIIMGHLGSDIVAANSIVTVVRDLVTAVGFGVSAAASILLGKEIGMNRLEMARQDARSILKTGFFVSLLQGIILLVLMPFIPGMVKISPVAAGYLRAMLLINIPYQMGQIINTVLIVSIFRCGGESRYGMILDIVCMWCYAVPLGLISAFVLKLPPLIVYLLMCTDEYAKMPFAFRHYRRGSWLKNLTRDFR